MNHFCTNCGNRLDTEERFCPKCGERADEENKAVKTQPTGMNTISPKPQSGSTTIRPPTTSAPVNNRQSRSLGSLLSWGAAVLICIIGVGGYLLSQSGSTGGSGYSSQQNAVLSGTYATQDMIRLNMTNSMGLTFYPNGTFQMRTGGMFKDDTGTYRLSGNSLIFSPSDPVYHQGNDPVTNGFTQALTGTVSDDRSTINYAGGVWVKTN